jgi:hypothetical protein
MDRRPIGGGEVFHRACLLRRCAAAEGTELSLGITNAITSTDGCISATRTGCIFSHTDLTLRDNVATGIIIV